MTKVQRSSSSQSIGEQVAVPRVVKGRLFGDDASDHLQKQVIKARLLHGLQRATGGVTGGGETREEGDMATEPSSRAAEIEPVRIGRYAILRKLGQGGMGVVYLAFDEKLDRKVAIKLLRGDLSADDRGRARMLREAQALARLSHPNVVQVHEVSQWNEHDYVAMEFIEGQTLDRWVAVEARGWQAVLEVMIQAGRGLEAAHAAKLVHRDFKPANLLLGRDGRARVLDFGLARTVTEREPNAPLPRITEAVDTAAHSRAGGASASSSGTPVSASDASGSGSNLSCATVGSSSAFDKLLTITGAALGTPAYMAPEQHLGQPATALSDQFSFCVVLYEALYGRRPFQAASRTEYAVRVTEGRFEAPPANTGVPVWLRRALVRGLDPVPGNRWPSMADLLAELGRDRTRTGRRILVAAGLLAGLGVALSVGSSEPKLCEFDGRALGDHWGESQREAVALAFASTGMPEADSVLEYTQRSLDRYAQALLGARASACEARWVTRSQTDAQLELRTACLDQRERELGAVVGVLADADQDVVLHAPELVAGLGEISMCARLELLEAGTPVPKDLDSVKAIAQVRGIIAQAHAKRDVGRVEDARALTASAWRKGKEIGFAPLLGEIHNLEARNARFTRDADESYAHLVEAVAIAHRHQHHELAAQAWLNLAFLAAESGADPDARIEFTLAAATVEQLGSSSRHVAQLGLARGLALQNAGRLSAALDALDQALDLADDGYAGSVHATMEILVLRSAIYASLGRVAEARSDLERVLVELGSPSRTQLDALFDLAVVEIGDREFDSAERDIKEAMRGYEALFGPRYASIGHGYLALSRIGLARDDREAANRGVDDARRILTEDHVDYDWVLDAVAAVEMRSGEYDAAAQTLRRAIAHRTRTTPDDGPRLAYLHERLAVALRDGGDLKEAVVEFEGVIARFEEDQIDAPLDLAAALLGLGQARLAQGQAQLALASLERAVSLAAVDCGNVWLAGESRVALAEALAQLELRSGERRKLAREAVDLLQEVPSSANVLARALELSEAEHQPKQPTEARIDR